MSARPRVGISILSLGAAADAGLEESLRSLADGGREIRVVHRVQGAPGAPDAGSRLEEIAPGIQRVWILQQQNMGFARGHNENVKALDGCDLVWILNDDVAFAPEALDHLVRFLEERGSCAVAGPEIVPTHPSLPRDEAAARPHDAGIGWWCPRKGTVAQLRSPLDAASAPQTAASAPQTGASAPQTAASAPQTGYTFVSGCAPLWRRSAFTELSGFTESFFLYHEDTDLALRAVCRFGANAIGFCPAARVFHLEGSSGRTDRTAVEDRSILFDYFDMRNGAVLIARHCPRSSDAVAAAFYYTFRAFRKVARPWMRNESMRLRKNGFTLLGMRDGLRAVSSGRIHMDPRVGREIERLAGR